MTLVKEPLVSVIIPTHNRADLLARSLESVSAQKYKNFEVIVIDDASEDDTGKTIESYRGKFKEFKVIRNKAKQGGAESRNVGIASSSGKYLAFLDDDDEWLPDKTAKQTAALERYPELGAMTCWYYNITPDRKRAVRLVPEITFDMLLYENFAGSFSSCLVRGEFARSLLLDASFKAGQDWQFWIMVSDAAKIGITEKCLVNYHDHRGMRISNSKNYISSTHRKLYFTYKSKMTALCRVYCLINIGRYRILGSQESFIKKIFRIMSSRMLLGTGQGRFLLKRSLLVMLDRKLHLYIYNPELATYKFVRQLN